MLAPALTGREVQIPAEDGRLLAATLFEPRAPAAEQPTPTIIAGGAGIAVATTQGLPRTWPSASAWP